MKNISTTIVGSLLLAGAAAGVFGMAAATADTLQAIANIRGMSSTGAPITGRAVFEQSNEGVNPGVEISVFVSGFEPNTVHGVHIHEVGDCTGPSFASAGGHFDPGPFTMSNPDANHPFHMGDLTNLEADNVGRAFYVYQTSRITLSDSPLSVFDADGSAIIIHLNADQGITGAAGSGVSGGPRIACGVVRKVTP